MSWELAPAGDRRPGRRAFLLRLAAATALAATALPVRGRAEDDQLLDTLIGETQRGESGQHFDDDLQLRAARELR